MKRNRDRNQRRKIKTSPAATPIIIKYTVEPSFVTARNSVVHIGDCIWRTEERIVASKERANCLYGPVTIQPSAARMEAARTKPAITRTRGLSRSQLMKRSMQNTNAGLRTCASQATPDSSFTDGLLGNADCSLKHQKSTTCVARLDILLNFYESLARRT